MATLDTMPPELTAEQLQNVCDAIAKQVSYLHKLGQRMDRIGFIPRNILRQHVEAAYDAVHSLRMHLHYAAVDARKREDEGKRPWETKASLAFASSSLRAKA